MTRFRVEDVWYPTPEISDNCNLAALMRRMGFSDYDSFLRASVENPEAYWRETLSHMGIVFDPPPTAFMDAQRAPLGPVRAPFQGDGLEDAAKAWLAHVDAGRIGGGVG